MAKNEVEWEENLREQILREMLEKPWSYLNRKNYFDGTKYNLSTEHVVDLSSGNGNGSASGNGSGLGTGLNRSSGKSYSWSNNTNDMLKTDIEQSHHFTIRIDQINNEIPIFTHDFKRTTTSFLPVKSIDYTVGTTGTMSFPLGVLGEFPIINKQNFGRMTLTLYDTDQEPIETAVRKWFSKCFPENKYVNYLSNIMGKMEYHSYGVTGRENISVSGTYLVIPVDSLSLNRSYDENSAKLFQLTLLVVGRI